MTKNVLHTIQANTDSYSKGQKRIAQYILDNYDKAAFMTAKRLGETTQVSESTVVRLPRSWATMAIRRCKKRCRS